ncbi:SurA N-terminal domain-containing protein [Microbacteriaceae bacterium K1510]|nr:SurA N-terminal domain-containing protein [Microbacteriaceae bacterium K1510]
MLRGIHKASSTWVGKALMALVMGTLVVAFAIWGIGDIFRGFGRNAVAKIGGTEISIEQFRQYYTDRLQQLGRQMGRPVTPDQARALGLDRQILGQMVAETTLDEETRRLRLGLSDAEIARRIMDDPNFKTPNGQFDRARFEAIIRNAGYTETRFVDEQRRVLLRRQIAQSVSADLRAPAAMLQAINQFQNERRDIEYLVLGPAQAGDVPQPSPEQLSAYFDERKILFRAPEYRKLTLVTLSPTELAKPNDVSDADAKAFFEQNKSAFGTPEKRELRQIVFPNEVDAGAAREKIEKGASFDDIAKARELKSSDTDLGLVEKTGIIDPAVADTAFALKSGEVSQPVKGRFGTVLLTVGKIEPGEQKSFEDVSAQIKQQIAESRARSTISDLRDKIEDERAGGATLAEAAKKLGVKSIDIAAIDRSGRGADGKPAADLPNVANLVNTVFSSDVGADTEALQLPGGGFLYFDVTGVTPAHDRPLDEVREQVAARWRDDEIAKRLQAKSDELLAKLKAGTPIAEVASANGLSVQTAKDLQRGRPALNVPAKLLDAVFTTAKGGVGATEGDSATQRFIFRVAEVTQPTFDASAPQTQALTSTLQNAYADDIIGEYVGKLESDLGVSINQAAFNQVIGGATEQ